MNSIPEIIDEIRSGRMVILIDDENRENEGDLILAADFVTPQAINFMATEARGLICLSLHHDQISRLGLPLMVKNDNNRSPNQTAFTVSIEAASGVSTGISAADRAHTVRVATNPLAKSSDVITPGHIFPIAAQDGGVLKRAGHTEASVDLARLAGLNQAAVICEIMNSDGTMARVDELKIFAKKHNIKIGTIEALIEYRLATECFVEERESAVVKKSIGLGFQVKLFKDKLSGREHFAFVKGNILASEPVLVRVHVENLMSDIFETAMTQKVSTLQKSIDVIENAGRGVLIYLRNTDLDSSIKQGLQMDEKDYGVGAQILRSLGLTKIILISNHSAKKVGIKGFGLDIVDVVQLYQTTNEEIADHGKSIEI
ncbi:MAG: 3,4-dihydroxy-2-butanone-4-phosphate synthase [Bdellovibrionales bacterium]